MFKKLTCLFATLFLGLAQAHADEGMWFLMLMQQQHLADSLRKAGLQLPPESLYSETGSSLRECVGIFGGGCTGEVVSADGLVLTNHHCGFSYVHEMSSLEHDYMKEGYFAHSRAEELPTPSSLTFTFILSITDVTDAVNAAASKQKVSAYVAQTQTFLEPLAQKMLKKHALGKKKGVSAEIIPFFSGNQYYLFIKQTYQDVRLVANPPYNVGQFGGNTDNWMWPRHNADFAMFRIYADANGDPAPYSPDNVPLRCKRFLPISLQGVNKGDYTMILGFPGSTSRFLTASEVVLRTQSYNAGVVEPVMPLLDYYKRQMDSSDALRLKYEDTYASLGNAAKNFQGMNEAVQKIGLVAQKKQEEAAFRTFAAQSGKQEYARIIERIDSLCAAVQDTLHDATLFSLSVGQLPIGFHIEAVDDWAQLAKEGKAKDLEESTRTLRQMAAMARQEYDADLTRDLYRLLLPIFRQKARLELRPAFMTDEATQNALLESIISSSVLLDSVKLEQAIAARNGQALLADPLYVFVSQCNDYADALNTTLSRYTTLRRELDKVYVRGLCEMYNWTKAPDANFTMRMTYGHVDDLKPRDAVHYDWRTVLDGMFEKESTTETDYFINERLRQLFLAADYGRYAREDGKLPTCFLSNNDITGGNSGSGVLNAKGELIGLAFDGNIESLSSDLKYNAQLQRCINVDIRYVLFIIDKFGGSTYVLDELDLR